MQDGNEKVREVVGEDTDIVSNIEMLSKAPIHPVGEVLSSSYYAGAKAGRKTSADQCVVRSF